MSDQAPSLILLGTVWMAYFAIHSLLASLTVKNAFASRWPGAMPVYRLTFNTLAVVLVLPPLWLMYRGQGPFLWQWQGPWWWLANALTALALVGFVWSLRHYDGQEFLGFRQLRTRQRSVMDQERFRLSPLHRYVRHPWYFLGLILIWTRDVDMARLVSFGLMSGYFLMGSWLEERKLMRYHGDVYRRYRARVPGLLPLPWRHLTQEQAQALLREDAGNPTHTR